MMILRALSLLLLVTVFSVLVSNQDLLVKHVESLQISADASEVLFEEEPVLKKQGKPSFMQVDNINEHELPAQARIGYLLSRGF